MRERGLDIQSSKGRLTTETKYLDESLDSGVPVTVYTHPSGWKSSPDPGWNYNPGKAAWKPDLKRFDPDIRKLK